jgi:putative sigma-54 modulation protein
METDEGVKAYVKEKVQKLQKYIESPREVHVVLTVEKFRHIAEVTIVGNGGAFNSQGRDSDLYAMISVRRWNARSRTEGRKTEKVNPSSFKTSPQGVGETSEGKEEERSSSLIRRKHLLAKSMSPEEAVSQLVLSKKDFLIFINSDSGQMNVVTRSKDGGYEWVEPHPK